MAILPTTTEERTWSMLAHLTILINPFTAILGPLIALTIYLVYRTQSRYIAYHSMQSLILQLITWVGAGIFVAITWIVTGLLSLMLIGLFLIPSAIIITTLLAFMPLFSLVYGFLGAIQCNQGKDFKYFLIGDWLHGYYEAITD